MKRDWGLYAALAIIIGLVIALIVIVLDNKRENAANTKSITELKKLIPKEPQVFNGKTPVLGIDYFNGESPACLNEPTQCRGRDSVSTHTTETIVKEVPVNGKSTYELAVEQGFGGSLNEWLDSLKPEPAPAPKEQLIDCKEGRLVTKYTGDLLWNITAIKCEVAG